MILLDTSFLVALYNTRDSQHEKAFAIQEKLANEKLLLAEYVLLELSTVLGLKASVEKSKLATEHLLNSKEINFIYCAQYLKLGLEIFHAQKVYKLSLIDSVLASILENITAGKIITFDEDLQKHLGKEKLFL